MVEEKRQSPRFGCEEIPVCLVEIDHVEEIGRLTNISRGGLGFQIPRQLREKTTYNLSLRLDGKDRAVPCRARIIWAMTNEATKSCYCGAAIEDIDTSQKVELIEIFYEVWKRREIARRQEKNQDK